MIKETKAATFLTLFSGLVIYLIGSIMLISSVFLSAKYDLQSNGTMILLLSLLFSVFLITWQIRPLAAIRTVLIHLVVSFAIILTATFIVSRIYDKSWDGLTYHQMAVLELANGWNPFYAQLPPANMTSLYTGRTEDMNLYINHYSKGSEIFGAIITDATGSVEAGKVFNFLLLLSAFCSVLDTLFKLSPSRPYWNYTMAVAAAFNPIAANQTFSYLVDGALGSAFLILLCHLILLFCLPNERQSFAFTNIFFLLILLMNLKFTGAVYAFCICFTFICVSIGLRRTELLRRFVIVTCLSAVVGVVLVGFNPYVVNTYGFGNPFYPVAGKKKVDVISNVMPPEFQSHNPFQKFIMSTFSRCENFDSVEPDKVVQLKLPFTLNMDEIRQFQSETTRLSGFGALWSGIFCLAILGSLALLANLRGKKQLYFVALVLAIGLSVMSNPESWWARFVPQLWLLPAVVSLFMINQGQLQNIIAKVLLVLMILNSVLVAGAYTYSCLTVTIRANQYLTRLANSSNPPLVYFDIFLPNSKKFEDRKIKFVRVRDEDSLPCDNKLSFLNMKACVVE